MLIIVDLSATSVNMSELCWLICRQWQGWPGITAVTSPLWGISEGSAQQLLSVPKGLSPPAFPSLHSYSLMPFMFNVYMELLRDRTRPFEPVISSEHTQHLPLFIVLFFIWCRWSSWLICQHSEFADRGRQTGLNSTSTTYLFLRKILMSRRKQKVRLGLESGKSQLQV